MTKQMIIVTKSITATKNTPPTTPHITTIVVMELVVFEEVLFTAVLLFVELEFDV